jgi:hypothetical protein
MPEPPKVFKASITAAACVPLPFHTLACFVKLYVLICEALLNFNLHVFQESYTRHRSNRYLLRF